MKVAVIGATGRMGQAVLRVANERHHQVVGACASSQSSFIGRDIGEAFGMGSMGVAVSAQPDDAMLGADVAIDFSKPAALAQVCRAARKNKVGLVVGTTGLDEAQQAELQRTAEHVPVLWSPNTSLGVYVLARLVREAAQLLGEGFDIEIVETHHKHKVDAPSGTAKRLLEAVQSVRGNDSTRQASGQQDGAPVYGREGLIGARPEGQIGVMTLRGGDVIGDHSVHFLGQGERLELVHRATSRDLFARGAVRIAEFLQGLPPGLYTMDNVFGTQIFGAHIGGSGAAIQA